jgi:hypothetical protein
MTNNPMLVVGLHLRLLPVPHLHKITNDEIFPHSKL